MILLALPHHLQNARVLGNDLVNEVLFPAPQ